MAVSTFFFRFFRSKLDGFTYTNITYDQCFGSGSEIDGSLDPDPQSECGPDTGGLKRAKMKGKTKLKVNADPKYCL
jgi:hypothetical protein